ncbi:hypothetical protein C8Q79DRAFT_1121993 [Trametes meyenii]|nr:hypothetical protein C8Q79DRAFT_1121993 [Trametes meyenii]
MPAASRLVTPLGMADLDPPYPDDNYEPIMPPEALPPRIYHHNEDNRASIQKVMELENHPEEFAYLMSLIRRIAKGLTDFYVPYNQQDSRVLRKIIKEVLNQAPIFYNYVDAWPVTAYLRLAMKTSYGYDSGTLQPSLVGYSAASEPSRGVRESGFSRRGYSSGTSPYITDDDESIRSDFDVSTASRSSTITMSTRSASPPGVSADGDSETESVFTNATRTPCPLSPRLPPRPQTITSSSLVASPFNAHAAGAPDISPRLQQRRAASPAPSITSSVRRSDTSTETQAQESLDIVLALIRQGASYSDACALAHSLASLGVADAGRLRALGRALSGEPLRRAAWLETLRNKAGMSSIQLSMPTDALVTQPRRTDAVSASDQRLLADSGVHPPHLPLAPKNPQPATEKSRPSDSIPHTHAQIPAPSTNLGAIYARCGAHPLNLQTHMGFDGNDEAFRDLMRMIRRTAARRVNLYIPYKWQKPADIMAIKRDVLAKIPELGEKYVNAWPITWYLRSALKQHNPIHKAHFHSFLGMPEGHERLTWKMNRRMGIDENENAQTRHGAPPVGVPCASPGPRSLSPLSDESKPEYNPNVGAVSSGKRPRALPPPPIVLIHTSPAHRRPPRNGTGTSPEANVLAASPLDRIRAVTGGTSSSSSLDLRPNMAIVNLLLDNAIPRAAAERVARLLASQGIEGRAWLRVFARMGTRDAWLREMRDGGHMTEIEVRVLREVLVRLADEE